MNGDTDLVITRRFRWGLLLAWAPFAMLAVPTILGIINAFRGISEQRATGLGAIVAGGLSEFFITFGLVATLVFEITAIILLTRSLSRSHALRGIVCILTICCSAFMLALSGLFFWLSTSHMLH